MRNCYSAAPKISSDLTFNSTLHTPHSSLNLKMQKLRYFILPLLYLGIGGIVTSMLVQRVVNYADPLWLFLLLPMLMVTVLLTVVGVVNVWVQYRSIDEDSLMRQYGVRNLLWLYLRCWSVVMAGLVLGVVYYWMHDLLADYIQDLLHSLDILFYVGDIFLTVSALMSIVRSVNLQEIRLRNAQTENQLLKAQLNPHFLYNTLNNIDALIWLDQERASAAVTSLSSLMRYMTYSSRQERVTIEEELKAMQQLVELQRLRTSREDCLVFEAEINAPMHTRIAPLLLIPLIENCFKHVGQIDASNAIHIKLVLNDDQLIFTTDNNIKTEEQLKEKGETSKSHSGVGLTVLQRRLSLLYAGKHSFTAHQDGDRFKTTLQLSVD